MWIFLRHRGRDWLGFHYLIIILISKERVQKLISEHFQFLLTWFESIFNCFEMSLGEKMRVQESPNASLFQWNDSHISSFSKKGPLTKNPCRWSFSYWMFYKFVNYSLINEQLSWKPFHKARQLNCLSFGTKFFMKITKLTEKIKINCFKTLKLISQNSWFFNGPSWNLLPRYFPVICANTMIWRDFDLEKWTRKF